MANNAKAKIKRIEKNFGTELADKLREQIAIPSGLRGKEGIKDYFSTREGFNQWKDRMRSFTNAANQSYQFEKNEHGVVASKRDIYEAKQNEKKAARIAQAARAKVDKLEFVSGGKATGVTVGEHAKQMKKPDYLGLNDPKEFDFSKHTHQRRLDETIERLREKADKDYLNKQQELLKNNWIKKLEEAFNSDADDLSHLVRGIPADEFFEIYKQFDEMDIKYFYDDGALGEGRHGHLDQLETYIDAYYTGGINTDLKAIK